MSIDIPSRQQHQFATDSIIDIPTNWMQMDFEEASSR